MAAAASVWDSLLLDRNRVIIKEKKKKTLRIGERFLSHINCLSPVSLLSLSSHFSFSTIPLHLTSPYNYIQDMAVETEYKTDEVDASRVASELIDTTFKSSTIGKCKVVQVPQRPRHEE